MNSINVFMMARQGLSVRTILTIFCALLILCELLSPILSIPLIIKNSIKLRKSTTQQHKTKLQFSQNHILKKLKYTINTGKNLRKRTRINQPYILSGKNVLPATPTTLKLKNAIRVLGYGGNKQIIPRAQQRQASVSLPFDVIAIGSITENTTETQPNTTEVPSTTQDISVIIDTIDNLIINNKVQIIDISEVDVDPNEQDQEDEEVECESKPDSSTNLIRNGLGDDSYFTWPDRKIPFVIGSGFNSSNRQNILDSVEYYNNIFGDCIKWVPRADEAVYVEFLNSGICYSRIGRVYWPFPLPQSIFIGRCAHLIGHVRHEMMHTMGFYHEHSRSDRDDYIDINWDHIAEGREDQFDTYRWTTAYGEPYDYDSIMHYSAKAFSRNQFAVEPMLTILPKNPSVNYTRIGRKINLSEIDIIKIKKLYKCPPYNNWDNGCAADNECGFNEHCSGLLSEWNVQTFGLGLLRGQCRTLLSDGSVCVRSEECLNICSSGRCTSCTQDGHCKEAQYCANTFLPLVQNVCSGWCEDICMVSAQCGGTCPVCSWRFRCEKQTRSEEFLNTIPLFNFNIFK